jgi:hypothetical protein
LYDRSVSADHRHGARLGLCAQIASVTRNIESVIASVAKQSSAAALDSFATLAMTARKAIRSILRVALDQILVHRRCGKSAE